MALNPQYIVAINLQEYLVDKDTGLPLANGYIQFWQDSARTTPKLVYQLTGNPPNYTYSPLPNPVNLSSVGVPTDANGNQTHIYYYPYDSTGTQLQLYYISVYNSLGVLQYTLQAWPNITPSTSPETNNNSVENQISNSQFVDVLFNENEGLTITFDSVLDNVIYPIAPGWDLIVSSTGAGTIVVNKIPIEGALNIITNPPFVLTFQPEGNLISNLILRQTLNNNPDIWSSTPDEPGYLSGIMLVNSLDGSAHIFEMQYTQSNGIAGPQTIVVGTTGLTGYNLLNNTILLNSGDNTDDGNTGAIFIDIVLPITGFYSLTSIQVVGLEDNTLISYQQETANRQKDHLFHYYQPELNFKPIKSYLTAWNFPLNPAQFGQTGTFGAYSSNYIWDQTIGYQSVVSSLSYDRIPTSNSPCYGSLQIEALTSSQFAIIQYLTVPEITNMLNNDLSCNLVLTANQPNLIGNIELYYTDDSSLPNINTNNTSLINSLNANGTVSSLNGNWTKIDFLNSQNAQFELSSTSSLNNLQSFNFEYWPAISGLNLSSIKYFAIVLGFATLNTGFSIVLNSCSLVPGRIATIPSVQTFSEVLKDSQYYYEKSYPVSVIPGSVGDAETVIVPMVGWLSGIGQFSIYAADFSIYYLVEKVSIPIINFWSNATTDTTDTLIVFSESNNTRPVASTGTNGGEYTFSDFFALSGSTPDTNKVTYHQKSSSSFMSFNSPTAGQTASASIIYTIDARLGVF